MTLGSKVNVKILVVLLVKQISHVFTHCFPRSIDANNGFRLQI